MSIKPQTILCLSDGVKDVKRMKCFRDGKQQESKSMCVTFVGSVLPERVYLQYLSFKVRPYERAPLRCFCCQSYGHVAAVCSRNRVCGRCGEESCNKDCEERQVKSKCVHCSGEHHAGSSQCPKREKEVKVIRVRAESRTMSYAEAVKRVEREGNTANTSSGRAAGAGLLQQEPERKRNMSDQNICMDKKRFLAFIAMVINCAVDIQTKTDRIKMVLEAARRFLDVIDVTGEDLDITLREEFTPSQASGTGM